MGGSYQPKYVYIDPVSGMRSLTPKPGYIKTDTSGSSTGGGGGGGLPGDINYQPGLTHEEWVAEQGLKEKTEQHTYELGLAGVEVEKMRLAEQKAANAAAAADAAGDRADAAAARELEAQIAQERMALDREIAQMQHEVDEAQLALQQKQYEQTVRQWESELASDPVNVVQYELYKRGELEPLSFLPSTGSAAPEQRVLSDFQAGGNAPTAPTAPSAPSAPSASTPTGVQNVLSGFTGKPPQMGEGGVIAIVGDSDNGKPNPELLEWSGRNRIRVTPLKDISLRSGGILDTIQRGTQYGWNNVLNTRPDIGQWEADPNMGTDAEGNPTQYRKRDPQTGYWYTSGHNPAAPHGSYTGGGVGISSGGVGGGSTTGGGAAGAGSNPPPADPDAAAIAEQFLPGTHTDEEMAALLAGAINPSGALYNPALGGMGVFGSRIPSPGELSRRKFLGMDPTGLGVLESFIRAGIDMGGGQRTAINPEDWFQMMQRSWIPGMTGIGTAQPQYAW